jgi:signal transduction histidine kinase
MLSSLRSRLAVTFGALALVLGVATVLGVGAFQRLLEARKQVIQRVDPAISSADRLVAAMVDQETGVRGYALSGERPFLEPYTRGVVTARAEAARLRALTTSLGDARPLTQRAIDRAELWRVETARPTIRLVTEHARSASAIGRISVGRARFDSFRAAAARLSTRLQVLRAQARAQLDHDTARLEAIILGGLLAVVVVGALMWAALRRWVVRPLASLGGAADRVAAGDLDRPIHPEGLEEIARLATQMEAMRARIVHDLVEVVEARTLLDEQAQDLQRSNAELEQFAYVASHDLQEPLRKIAGFCGMLQRRYGGQLDERADQYIDFAVDGATRMQRLINDLLAFSRVGRTTEGFGEVPLDTALAHALTNLGTLREETGATVTSDELPVVVGDASLLTALLQNLIGNALKFRGAEPPRIHVSCTADGDNWSIAVADNGIGIEPAYAERVFVIFQRLHAKDAYEGTGIGLSMCKKIVEFHGGRIAVEPSEGPGTTVRFTLPVHRSIEAHG